MLTVFSTCKPWVGHSAIIQENALQSWASLIPKPQIILFGDEEGTKEAAERVGAEHITEAERNSYGTPLLRSLFLQAQEHSQGNLLVYVNADIILLPSAVEAIKATAKSQKAFLLVCKRIDLEITEHLDFSSNAWIDEMERDAKSTGKLGKPIAIDFFAFTKGIYQDIPDFAVARTCFDNWLIWSANSRHIPVVDGSAAMTLVHQSHDYASTGGRVRLWDGPEAQHARELLGGWTHYHTVTHAKYMLNSDYTVTKAKGFRYMWARPSRLLSHALRATRPLRRRLAGEPKLKKQKKNA